MLCTFPSQVSFLTYPLTLVPPAQMIEHYMLSYSCIPALSVPNVSSFASLGEQQHHHNHSYGALELDLADLRYTESPVRGGDGDKGSSVDLYSAAGGECHREVSLKARCVNRFFIVVLTTVISTWIPCFGMVR